MTRKKFELIATAFDKQNRIICSATNSYSDSCSLMRYYAIKTACNQKVFNHAEIACISKAMKMQKKIDKLVILRYDSVGNLKNAHPCRTCASAIADFGIKKVFYSDEGIMKRYENRG